MQTKQELFALGVHKLRELARQMGVKAPTTKRQGELVEEILKIQSGKQAAIKSNMGRPPKKVDGSDTYIINDNSQLVELTHAISSKQSRLNFEDSIKYEKKDGPIKCLGVIRKAEGNYFFRNYKNLNDFAIIQDLKPQMGVGTLVEGEGFYCSADVLKIEDYYEYNFSDARQLGKMATLVSVKSVEDAYNYILKDNGVNKIVSEIEANVVLSQKLKDQIFIHTEECEDITESYNMLIDLKALIENLVRTKKSFTLYLMDVCYMYDILNIYYQIKKVGADINAGQYFKELLSKINNSGNSRVVLFERFGSERSSYLNIVLKKYCNVETFNED